ncbi:alpha/beta hydrolase [Aquibacillus koreensis]|uniref:Alpha/beta hydrolase n=1 Tax=Aquibacillus koreensis TaxID=279446 RepID=A0A9X3WNT4_9BACI|nr:alpha/beta hydrolase [Aquibacillus koreensis]MCT2535460.1 alpha/beta hydrolase [Aquibacillus koreensis]MDC3422295.1 alpha/beta hydrolase [Aquibacillus koreensis]
MMNNLEIEHVLKRLALSEHEIDFETPVQRNDDIELYLHYYGFQMNNIAFHFGKLTFHNTRISVYMFKPKVSKGTIFLLHGYLSHVGHLKYMINFLTETGYTVISYDLQGHGLSEGKTASIYHFSSYVKTMEQLIDDLKQRFPQPFHVIGHSTGAAIVMDYLLSCKKPHDHDKFVLVAPLIRSKHWHVSKYGYYLVRLFPFISEVRRFLRENSSNEKYLTFTSEDPLQTDAIPIEWIGAVIDWNKQIERYPVNQKSNVLVIQGNQDTTVDWKHNISIIQKKFIHVRTALIDDGRHELFNEAQPIRGITFSKLKEFLDL